MPIFHTDVKSQEAREAAREMNRLYEMFQQERKRLIEANVWSDATSIPPHYRFYLGWKQMNALHLLNRHTAQAVNTDLATKTLFGVPYIEVRHDDYSRLI